MMKKWIVAALAVATVISGTAAAQGPAATQEDRGSDKLDLKKLEDKYWSAKDSDFTVVQNRTYTKAGRSFVSLSYGPLVNDAYSYGRMTNLTGGYYFTERYGLELSHETGDLKDNDSTSAFINDNDFAPNYNRFKSYTSLNFVIVPFYAKMSLFDRKIMYFDMQFAFGLGQMNYQIQKVTGIVPNTTASPENKSAIGYNFDVAQQFFFHENFAIRFDIKNKWSRQEKHRYYISNEPETNRNLSSYLQQDTTMLLGLTFFF